MPNYQPAIDALSTQLDAAIQAADVVAKDAEEEIRAGRLAQRRLDTANDHVQSLADALAVLRDADKAQQHEAVPSE